MTSKSERTSPQGAEPEAEASLPKRAHLESPEQDDAKSALRAAVDAGVRGGKLLDDEDAAQLCLISDTMLEASRLAIIAQGYPEPEVREIEEYVGMTHKILVFGTKEGDYLADAARDCATRGQEVVYNPFGLIGVNSCEAQFSSIHQWIEVSNEMIVSGRLDSVWVHERSHAIVDWLRSCGIDHPQHGKLEWEPPPKLRNLPYAGNCHFDELLGHKEEVVDRILRLNLGNDTINVEPLKSLRRASYDGLSVAVVLSHGVVNGLSVVLDQLVEIAKDPNNEVATTQLSGRGETLAIRNRRTFQDSLLMWESKEIPQGPGITPKSNSSLMVKLRAGPPKLNIDFELADRKWLEKRVL